MPILTCSVKDQNLFFTVHYVAKFLVALFTKLLAGWKAHEECSHVASWSRQVGEHAWVYFARITCWWTLLPWLVAVAEGL